MELKYEVRAEKNSEPLAAFQYREWAEEWKHKMCRTGVIVAKHQPLVGGDATDRMVPVQEDGGGTRLVNETELPDYPRDGGRNG